MNAKTAQAIMEANNVIGLDLEHYPNYSGRGMFGKQTDGISGQFSDLVQAIAQAAADIARSGDGNDSELEEFIEDLGSMSKDSLGRDTIFY